MIQIFADKTMEKLHPVKAFRLRGKCAPRLLNDCMCCIVACTHAFCHRLASNKLRKKPAHKGISGSICVDQLFLWEGNDRVQLDLQGSRATVKMRAAVR